MIWQYEAISRIIIKMMLDCCAEYNYSYFSFTECFKYVKIKFTDSFCDKIMLYLENVVELI